MSLPGDATNWQLRRSRLNHDWLKNVYLVALGNWASLLADEVEHAEFEATFVDGRLRDWETRGLEIEELIRTFEDSMSPREMFARRPLSACDEPTSTWLVGLVHELWLRRCNVLDLCRVARERLVAAAETYATLRRGLEGCPTTSVAALRPMAARFEALRSACSDLSRAISAFPNRVEVV